MFARILFALGLTSVLLAAPARAAAPAREVAPLKRMQMQRLAEEPLRERAEARLEARERTERHGFLRRLAHTLRLSGRDELRVHGDRAKPVFDDGPARGTAPTRLARPDGANAIGTNVRCNDPMTDALGDTQSETSIVRWGNYLVAAWNDGTGYSNGSYQVQGWGTSTDGGQTWTDQGTFPVPAAYPDWKWASDPVLAVNSATGAFYFAALVDVNSAQNAIGVVKGRFTGTTFTWGTPTATRLATTSTEILDKEWIAVEPTTGRVYLSYTDFLSNGAYYLSQIDFQYADSSLTAWSATQQLSLAGEAGAVQGSRPVAAPGGAAYVVYYLIGPTDVDYLRICRSTNGGGSFAAPNDIVSFYSNYGTGAPGFNRVSGTLGIPFPSIACDRSGGTHDGRLYVAWPECLNWYDDFSGLSANNGSISEVEPDDSASIARPFTLGQTLRGAINTSADIDMFSCHLNAGQSVLVECDSISTNFFDDPSGTRSYSLSMRMIAPDGHTRLAFTSVTSNDIQSYNGVLYGPMWLYTAPVAGTYYLRAATTPVGGPGGYRLRTAGATHGTERGRDQRDVFVSYSDNGTSWSTPARVSQSGVGYDDWLPEVAVSPDGIAYCAWYDWRDAAAGAAGGESSTYLALSADAGASWSEVGAVSDTRTGWTYVSSNLQPNQGDYISMYATTAGVAVAWADGRNGSPDVYMQWLGAGIPVSTAAVAAMDHIDLTWFVDASPGFVATLYRSVGASGTWTSLGTLTSDASRNLHYTDTDVALGTTYHYRLGVTQNAVESFYGAVDATIPSNYALALSGARPNPASNAASLSFTLATSGAATLDLIDLTGRRVQSRAVGDLGAGPHVVPLTTGEKLKAGVYWVRLTQDGVSRSKRIVLL